MFSAEIGKVVFMFFIYLLVKNGIVTACLTVHLDAREWLGTLRTGSIV